MGELESGRVADGKESNRMVSKRWSKKKRKTEDPMGGQRRQWRGNGGVRGVELFSVVEK